MYFTETANKLFDNVLNEVIFSPLQQKMKKTEIVLSAAR